MGGRATRRSWRAGGAARSAFAVLLALAALMSGRLDTALAQSTPPRLALIIANQSYTDAVGPLANPHNDARLIEAALSAHGFETEVLFDRTEDAMELAIRRFARRVRDASRRTDAVAFFYYAGHGAAEPETGDNYLIPVDVESLTGDAVWAGSVRLDWIRNTLRAIAPDAQHIVVFDACRDELRLPARTRGRRGFETPGALGGMLTAFSAAPGQPAEDGAGRSSGPYAAELARQLRAARGVTITTVFDEVGYAFAGRRQRPQFWHDLRRRIVIGAPRIETPPPPRIETQPAPRIEATTSPLDGATVFLTGETSRLEPLSVFRECDVCPEMVALPGGTFTMGSPETEAGRQEREGPQQRVTIQPFAMGRTEVTFAMWDACAADGFCRTVDYDWGWGRDQRPVILIFWNDITGENVSERGFLAWLNSRPGVTGAPYRLPSEAEWEYAARGDRQTAYSFGESAAQLGQYGWHNANSNGRTQPVGRLRSNPFGLYDVHGNVWEWVRDCWNASLDASLRTGQARMTGDCSRAVLRGGSWSYTAENLRSADRGWGLRDLRYISLGFRISRTLLE